MSALKRIRPFISESTALQIYQALILPHFDYCSSIWDELNITLSDKLQIFQRRSSFGYSGTLLWKSLPVNLRK